MNLLNELTIKNLKLNKKRTIVTIIGIMLSIALITAVASIYVSGIQSLITFEKQRTGDFQTSMYNVSNNDLNIIEHHRGVKEVYVTQNVGYAKINSKNTSKPYAFIKSFSKEALSHLSIRLVEGRLPQNDTEILIPTHLKTNGRVVLNVGDTITLDVGNRVDELGNELLQSNPFISNQSENESKIVENIVNTTSKTYTIVGIIERPDYNIEQYEAPGYTFVTYLNNVNKNQPVDVYIQYTKQGVENWIETTASLLGINDKILEQYLADVSYSDKQQQIIDQELSKVKYQFDVNDYLIKLETKPLTVSGISDIGKVAAIIIGIIIFTSVFCIKNSFNISITEKVKQYGMLRSIGATSKQIRKNVLYEATILGAIGIPLGIILGLMASVILIMVSNYYLGSLLNDGSVELGLKLQFTISYIAILIAVILGSITIYLSAFSSALKAAKISPIDAIKNSAGIKIKAKKIKSPKWVNKLFGIGGEISYKNLKRNRKKYRTTTISIAVSVFVFIALSSFMTLGFDVAKREINVSDANLILNAYDFDKEDYKKFIETTHFDTIKKVSVSRETSVEVSSSLLSQEYIKFLNIDTNQDEKMHIIIKSLDQQQYLNYIQSLGLNYDDIKDQAIVVDWVEIAKYDKQTNESIKQQMRLYNLEKNDIVKANLNDGSEFNFTVGYVTQQLPESEVNQYVQRDLIIVSEELFDKINQEYNLEIKYQSTNANQLQDKIDETLINLSYSMTNIDEQNRMMNNLLILIGIFLYGFIIVVSLIGVTNIFNTITTTMELRKQEFAMLKSIGMTKKEFNRMIRLESMFMGTKSLAIGVPIGIVLSYAIYHFLGNEIGLSYKLPLNAIIIAIITVLILISIIMKYSINKINQQNTIETIRNENI